MGTTTPIRGLYKPARGEVDWDVQVNANFDNLDATANTSYVDTGDANTLASAEAYTNNAVSGITSPVTSVAGKTGAVTLVEADIGGLTADLAAKAPLASPTFTGIPAAPTATAGTSTTQLATTAFVGTAIAGITFPPAPVTSVAGKTGAVTLVEGDIANLTTDLAAKAPLASPVFTGTPTAPTPAAGDNSTNIATTAYVMAAYPKVVAKTIQKAETGADATLLTYTPPAVAGTYRVTFVLSIPATFSGNLGWSVAYTDVNGTAQSPANLNLFTTGVAGAALSVAAAAGKVCYGELCLDTNNSGTAIVVKATATASGSYVASATIERLA